MTNDIQNYIKQMREQGHSDLEIKEVLKRSGWSDEQINSEFISQGASVNSAEVQPISPEQGSSVGFSEQIQQRRIKVLNKKSIFIASLVFFVISATGIFAALYAQTWSPTWSPFRETPAEVFEKAWENMRDVELVKFQANFDWSMRSNEGEDTLLGIKINVQGTEDSRDDSNYKLESSINAAFDYAGIKFETSGDIILIEQDPNFYIRFRQIPVLPLLGLMGESELNQLIGEWMSVNHEKDVGVSFFDFMEEIETDEPDFPDFFKNIFKEPEKYQLSELKGETIEGKKTYRYRFIFTTEELSELEELSEFDKELSGYLGEISVDVWISKKDKLVKKLVVGNQVLSGENKASQSRRVRDIFSYLGATLNYVTVSDSGNHVLTSPDYLSDFMDTTLIFESSSLFSYPDSLDKEIEAPQEYKTFDELFGFEESRRTARDTQRVANVRNTMLALELYYDGHGGQYPTAITPGTCENASRILALIGLEGLPNPDGTQYYFYGSNEDGSDYIFGAHMEQDENYPGFKGTKYGCNCGDLNYCSFGF